MGDMLPDQVSGSSFSGSNRGSCRAASWSWATGFGCGVMNFARLATTAQSACRSFVWVWSRQTEPTMLTVGAKM